MFYRDIDFDLQLFAGEKTEKPTAKKREDAKKKGQVGQSREINTAVGLFVAFTMLKHMGPGIIDKLKQTFYFVYSTLPGHDISDQFGYIGIQMVYTFLVVTMPIMGAIAVTAVFINFIQIGPVFSFESIQPKLSKLNPLEGMKRIFSKRSLVEMMKSIMKIFIIGYMLYFSLKKQYQLFPLMVDMDLMTAMSALASLTFSVVQKVVILLFALAVLDFLFQKWQMTQDLKMTKQEIKDEYKQSEGDPQLKGKIREKQRQMAFSRMMEKVPQADVIITNPTHLAIALEYKQGAMSAPVVIAKGADKMAERIKSIAKEHEIAIVENKPLAQALFKSTNINQSIPLELYQTVAEVLAYVYNLKTKKKVI